MTDSPTRHPQSDITASAASSGTLRVSLGTAPQYHDRISTQSIMWTVVTALLPAAAWGVYVYGSTALVVLMTAVAVSLVTEALIAGSSETLADGSAILTGLLIGMMMPPEVPLHVVVAASVFAIAVVKWTFGGLGNNWMNPALAGRVFVQFSWAAPMNRWIMPRTLSADAIATATPLKIVRTAVGEGESLLGGAAGHLSALGFPRTALDSAVTGWLNESLLGRFGANLPAGYVDPFVGNVPGAIGEGSALLLLLGTLILFGRRIITWQIPAAFFVVFAACTWLFGGIPYGSGAFSGDVLFHLLSGAVILVMFYMATDPVTTPMTGGGMALFGAGAGLLTFVIRAYGGAAEGAALAVLVMNVCTPAINRITTPRRFGQRPGGNRR